ncbi:MAG: dienelactone hydrolase family protein [Chryseolinea sp.]
MHTTSYKIPVSESIGEVSAIMNVGENSWCTLTLAHGAGAGMTHSFMSALAGELATLGIDTLRFNFPFIEAKKKRPDFAPVAEKTVEAVIKFTEEIAPARPLFVSGKSFGGRMSSQFLSRHHGTNVKGIVFFGFPLHVANEPAITRAEHLKDVQLPMLFLQGTKDALARLDLIEGVCSSLSFAVLQTFEGADHAFMRGKKSFINELATAAESWLARQCGRP